MHRSTRREEDNRHGRSVLPSQRVPKSKAPVFLWCFQKTCVTVRDGNRAQTNGRGEKLNRNGFSTSLRLPFVNTIIQPNGESWEETRNE